MAFGPVADVPDDALLDLFLINTLAPIRLLQAALPHLVASREAGNSPFVVNLSAVVAEQPTAGMAAYSASRPRSPPTTAPPPANCAARRSG